MLARRAAQGTMSNTKCITGARHDHLIATRRDAQAQARVGRESPGALDDSRAACKNLLAWIQAGGLTVIDLEAGDFERVAELMEKYADLPMDFTDAVVVAQCERLGIIHVASVDRDFAIYRFKGRTRFI